VPDDVAVHVLPAGDVVTPTANLRYRDTRRVKVRAEQAYRAARAYLAGLDGDVGGALHARAGGAESPPRLSPP
jgi:hypothetical protein